MNCNIEQLREYGKMILGKPAFGLKAINNAWTFDINRYKGKVNSVKNSNSTIDMETDKMNNQSFDRSTEIINDGELLVCNDNGYSEWCILLKKPKDYNMVFSCDTCTSRCKKSQKCSLFENRYGNIFEKMFDELEVQA